MATLQLFHDFAGRITSERRIQPGVYEQNDPRLFGCADYLIQHGFAKWVDDVAAPVVEAIQAESGAEVVSFPIDATPAPEFTSDDEIKPEVINPEPEPEVVDEIEFKGRKIKRHKPKG